MNWNCQSCNEEIPENTARCWRCGIVKGGMDIAAILEPVNKKRQERPEPTPFNSRMNTYFGREEDTPIPRDSYRSKMPFWMAQIQLILTPAKSIEYIRRALKRIRWRVRNSS